jgi:hypothetical protein
MKQLPKPAPHDPIQWQQVSPVGLSELAVSQHLIVGSFVPETDPEYVTVDGVCPACFGPLHRRFPAKVQPEEPGEGITVGVPVLRKSEVIDCNCGLPHPSQLPGETGCGRFFMLHLAESGADS